MTLSNTEYRQLVALVRKADDSQLTQTFKVMKERRNQLSRMATAQLTRGVKVTFKPRKTKPAVTGIVEKVNSKTVTVGQCSDGIQWRVPGNMLTVVK